MIINAYRNPPTAFPGTRLLETTLGIVGVRIPDPANMRRVWEVQSLYLPLRGRAIGGIRTKLSDQKGFVTFCNQRDLEVMLGIGRSGEYCAWADDEYVSPEDERWCGFCCDDDDLMDNLFEREMFLRAQVPGGVLPSNLDIERRVHLEHNNDFEEVYVLLADMDFDTGMFPDPRFSTVDRRWVRSERKRVRWEQS